MTAEFAECEVCDDCALWHSNADVSGIEDPDRVAEVKAADRHFIVDCGEEAEFCTAFSWSRCDACGTSMGGSRHRAFVEVAHNPTEGSNGAQ